MLGARYWVLGAGYKVLGTRYKVLGTGFHVSCPDLGAFKCGYETYFKLNNQTPTST